MVHYWWNHLFSIIFLILSCLLQSLTVLFWFFFFFSFLLEYRNLLAGDRWFQFWGFWCTITGFWRKRRLYNQDSVCNSQWKRKWIFLPLFNFLKKLIICLEISLLSLCLSFSLYIYIHMYISIYIRYLYPIWTVLSIRTPLISLKVTNLINTCRYIFLKKSNWKNN